jgi:cob(I)alamin adenosyltransferase
MIHIYIGDGKGKTTAAVGLAIRSLGAGGNVLFAQFLKSMETGEVNILKGLDGLVLIRPNMRHKKFIWHMSRTELEETKADILKGFKDICEIIEKNGFSLVVLDEVLDIILCGFLEEPVLISLLKSRPETEFVLTGRDASEKLRSIAGYVTLMQKEKHPYDQGIKARKGIEY